MTPRTDIAIIVVGINSKRYVQDCLRSLAFTEWRGYSHQVVYIDNASSDGSVETVCAEFPGTTIVANERNEGFCKACNQGVAASDSRYVYLLNNDTLLFPDSVPLLTEFLDRTPAAAVAGNRLLNPDLSDQWSARRFPTALNALFGRRSLLSRWFPNSKPVRDYLFKDQMSRGEPFPVDWVPGSCTLVRREAYDQVGGLPEEMHYWSDAVFCARLCSAGWKIYVVPKAKLVHYEGQGTGRKTSAARRWLISDFHEGAYCFYCEHYGLEPGNLMRRLARMGLALRARLIILVEWLSSALQAFRSF